MPRAIFSSARRARFLPLRRLPGRHCFRTMAPCMALIVMAGQNGFQTTPVALGHRTTPPASTPAFAEDDEGEVVFSLHRARVLALQEIRPQSRMRPDGPLVSPLQATGAVVPMKQRRVPQQLSPGTTHLRLVSVHTCRQCAALPPPGSLRLPEHFCNRGPSAGTTAFPTFLP